MPRRCRGIRGDVGIAPYGRSIEVLPCDGGFFVGGAGNVLRDKSEGASPRFCYAS